MQKNDKIIPILSSKNDKNGHLSDTVGLDMYNAV